MIAPQRPQQRQWRPNILIFGASGTGKTRTWLDLVRLTGAKCLAIDTHHGTDAWANTYPTGWDVVHTASPDEIEAQVDHYCARPSGYSMLVVDDITVAHTMLQDAADDELRPLRKRKDSTVGKFSGVLDPGAWGIVKRLAHISINKLTHLDMARVVVARSKPHYTVLADGKRIASGNTFAGDKDMEYSFDLVLQLEKFGSTRVAVVEKARGINMPATIEDFTAEKLLALLPCGAEGFTDQAKPEALIDREQAQFLRALFADAALEPGRQTRALAAYGATTIDDVPAARYLDLVQALRTVIAKKASETLHTVVEKARGNTEAYIDPAATIASLRAHEKQRQVAYVNPVEALDRAAAADFAELALRAQQQRSTATVPPPAVAAATEDPATDAAAPSTPAAGEEQNEQNEPNDSNTNHNN